MTDPQAPAATQTAHTPGPWSVCDDGEPGEPMLKVVGRTARHEIVLCCTGAVSPAEETANAALIAASPDLLNALREMVETYREGCADDAEPSMVRRALAAIARATGAQP